jgi:hypothetical protein
MNLSCVKSSGNIISEDFCLLLANDSRSDYINDASFGITKVNDHIARTFESLSARWEEIRTNILSNSFDNSQLRDKWLKHFFAAFDFNLTYNKSYIENAIHEKYNLSYLGGAEDDSPVIHIVSLNQDLDKKDLSNKTHSNKSPHDMLQNFVNTSPHKWAVLTNGKKLRIIRDFHHSITKGFLEFDLEGIFETASSEQFRILYRILHKSRFINQKDSGDPDKKCLLEKYYELSRDTGVEIGKKLRDQVHNAIEVLGNGFTEHLDWQSYTEKETKELYNQILNIIYRTLFLLFAEQKGWLPIKNDVYANTYSINALRNIVEKGDYFEDNHSDLWEGLLITFKLVSNGYTFPNGDVVNAFGGQLFSDRKISIIRNLPLKNKFLLKAIHSLCYFEIDKIINRINYTTLDINALGSVYESLLDYEPKILKAPLEKNNIFIPPGTFILDDTSFSRKTSGSYFTDPRLVALLIDSALKPVIENKLKEKTSAEEKEAALLDLKVCDMACGSGAFLIAALETLGNELAIIRKGDEELPTDEQLREAKREVLLHCIHGVDLNPMAVELCKFSLWITASMPNFPLLFLDHKIKCGNSLIGATPKLIADGIPAEAYNPVTLDDPAICAMLKKKVNKELEQIKKGTLEFTLPLGIKVIDNEAKAQEYLKVLHSQQESINEVDEVEQAYFKSWEKFHNDIEWKLADTWTASFFINKDSANKIYPTNETLYLIETGHGIDDTLEKEIISLSAKYNFFHWHLEFRDVFEKGGFDCILGNPPWERIKLQEKEFFESRSVEVANAKTAAQRKRLIQQLITVNPEIFKEYQFEKRISDCEANYTRESNKYPLTSIGDINTYTIFIESACINVIGSGRIGFIVPTGIATDDSTKVFLNHVVENQRLHSIYGFENEGKLFHGLMHNFKFCLITLTGSEGKIITPDFAFSIWFVDQLDDLYRHFTLTKENFKLLNPNTQNCPIFRNKYDAELTIKIYNNIPILKNYNLDSNSWKINYGAMFHMTNDSNLFRILDNTNDYDHELSRLNFEGNYYYPLYEAKMISFYDHRYANAIPPRSGNLRGSSEYTSESQHKDKSFSVRPRFWIKEENIPEFIKNKKWLIGFRGITGAVVNQRTTIFSFIPPVAVGNTMPLVDLENATVQEAACFIANMNSITLDFITRQKLGGTALNFFILNQLAVLPRETYSTKKINGEVSLDWISSRVLKLSYTSFDMKRLALDFGYDQEPFDWNERERFNLMRELDAAYAHLYGLTKAELELVLENFRSLNKIDFNTYGSFRTKEAVLKYYDEIEIE